MKPRSAPVTPRLSANKGRTGFFDMVELRMAKPPGRHMRRNSRCLPDPVWLLAFIGIHVYEYTSGDYRRIELFKVFA